MIVMDAGKLRRLVREVRLQIDPEMSLQRFEVLLSCLENPDGIDQQKIFELTGQTRSAVSKNVADLSALTSKKELGPGLVRSEADPMNLSAKRVTVTERGREVWRFVLHKAGVAR